jgi:8-oxo-dGTP pyrophosphatase MutT (NUDIX family)
MPVPVQRRSARAILLDRCGRVLLIRFSVLRVGRTFVFWAPPGGSVEAGETDLEAARREIKEELAIDVDLTGPVHVSADRFPHKGTLVDNTDVFYVARWIRMSLNCTRWAMTNERPCSRHGGGRARNSSRPPTRSFHRTSQR